MTKALSNLFSSHWLIKEFRFYFRSIWIFLAPIILSPLLFIGTSESRCLFTILLMSSYWIVEVAPLAATAFLPVFMLPMLGVLSVKKVASSFITDNNMLFISSMMVSLAVEQCNLHKRIALKMLSYVGAKPQWLIAGFMCITTFVSLWITDTATAALMAPIAYALLEMMMIPRMAIDIRRVEEECRDVVVVDGHERRRLDVRLLSPRDRGFCKALMLTVSHAALIGGTGTINSTGPNLIFKDTLQTYFPGVDTGISYLSWIAFSFPPMFGFMLSSWFVVQLQLLGIRHVMGIFRSSTPEEKKQEKFVEEGMKKAYDALGPMSFAEKSVLFWFVLLISLWVSSDPRVVPGWISLFNRAPGFLSDSCPGMLIVFILFVWPSQKPDFWFLRDDNDDRDRASKYRREPLLTWKNVQDRFQWSVILLLGTGFGISHAVKESGLSVYMACHINTWLDGFPLMIKQAMFSSIVTFMTEFSTNAATASIFIPISFAMGAHFHAHPLYFSIPAAIAPSFSFMLPMATSANAIVYESKTITMFEMASCGLFLNVFCVLFVTLNMNTWAYWLFDMGTYPEYASMYKLTTNCSGSIS